MSLSIDVDTVISVLLADGWHDVVPGSFELDSYEFFWSGINGVCVDDLASYPRPDGTSRDFVIMHGGGQSGVCSTGFLFEEESPKISWVQVKSATKMWHIAGPLTAILAVRTERRQANTGDG